MENTLEFLQSVAAPAQTKTYIPITHEQLVNSVLEQVDKAGLKVKNQYFSHNRSGQQMFGNFTVTADESMDMNIGFRNSYDKSMQLGLVAGTRVIVCSNLMFKGDFKKVMMHTGEVVKSLEENVKSAVQSLEVNYKQLKKDAKKLQSVKVDKGKVAELVGEMLMYEDLITTTQVKIIRNELDLQENFGNETMWDIYNHTTEALKTTPVAGIVDRHIGVHQYFMAKM